MRLLPSGTVTFLFTDIEGSTRLLEELGAEYAAVLEDHRRVIRAAVARHGGVEVGTEGDSFFVVFGSAREAVKAAEEVQEELARGPARVRMGLHTGEATATDDGYVGIDVHRSARICGAAHGGQVVLSETTRGLVDVDTADLGSHRLKDLMGPAHLYQLGRNEFPPLRTLHRTTLPVQPTPFLGRERELGELVNLLLQTRPLLVTLSGPGGSGKTRLAVQAAAEVTEGYPEGVFFVSLASVRDWRLASKLIAQGVGVRNELAVHIADRRLLLVLDNLEQIVDAASGVSDLIAACPNLTTVVTSREPLRLAAEQEYAVLPLVRQDAVALFSARAKPVSPSLDDDKAIAEICARLDDLPLAVELAATRARALSPAQILARLDRRLPMLTRGRRDAPERQRTLRATIEWSYDLLGADEQRLLRRLAVFVDGFVVEAAEKVAEADLDVLESLIEKNLLRHDLERFVMLQTIREFAYEHLEESGEAEEIRRRHAQYSARSAWKAGRLARQGDAGALARLTAESANAREAFDWAIANDELELCERLVEGLWMLWMLHGMTAEGYRRAKIVLARSAAPSPRFLGDAGELARFSGDLLGAVALKQRAIAAHRRVGEEREMGVVFTDLAEILIERGDLEAAEEAAQRGLEIRSRFGHPFDIAHARAPLVRLELRFGNHLRAALLSDELATVFRAQRRPWDLAEQCVLAAMGYRRAGDRARAGARVREALELGRELEDTTTMAPGLEQAAALAAESGEHEVALRLYGAAQASRQTSGYVYDRDNTAEPLALGSLEPARHHALLAEGADLKLKNAVSQALDVLERLCGADETPSAETP